MNLVLLVLKVKVILQVLKVKFQLLMKVVLILHNQWNHLNVKNLKVQKEKKAAEEPKQDSDAD